MLADSTRFLPHRVSPVERLRESDMVQRWLTSRACTECHPVKFRVGF